MTDYLIKLKRSSRSFDILKWHSPPVRVWLALVQNKKSRPATLGFITFNYCGGAAEQVRGLSVRELEREASQCSVLIGHCAGGIADCNKCAGSEMRVIGSRFSKGALQFNRKIRLERRNERDI